MQVRAAGVNEKLFVHGESSLVRGNLLDPGLRSNYDDGRLPSAIWVDLQYHHSTHIPPNRCSRWLLEWKERLC